RGDCGDSVGREGGVPPRVESGVRHHFIYKGTLTLFICGVVSDPIYFGKANTYNAALPDDACRSSRIGPEPPVIVCCDSVSPAITATYCLPSTSYVMLLTEIGPPSTLSHSTSPVSAWRAW